MLLQLVALPEGNLLVAWGVPLQAILEGEWSGTLFKTVRIVRVAPCTSLLNAACEAHAGNTVKVVAVLAGRVLLWDVTFKRDLLSNVVFTLLGAHHEVVA